MCIRMKNRLLAALAAVMLMEILFTSNVKAEENIEQVETEWQTDAIYEGVNTEHQNYSIWSHPVRSYLTLCQDGSFMRVQEMGFDDGILVEYYDPSYRLLSSKMIGRELPIFGAFYETEQYYFLLTGQLNTQERPDVEVYRMTKYDKNWNRISSVGLSDCNTIEPFYAGSARMDADGEYLYIRTCHLMYKSLKDGLNHQANVTMVLNMESMQITESYTAVSRSPFGYVSHSFNQFIKVRDHVVAAVDHGDAYPREIRLVINSTDAADATPSGGKEICILSFPGETGENRTGASVGAFEISDSSYLIAGNSVIQDANNLSRKTRNVFIASVDRHTNEVAVNWLTDYQEGDVSASTPYMVCISDNQYLLLWSRDEKTVFYTLLDGTGKQAGSVYEMNGSLSDCAPIVAGGRLAWYVWEEETIVFYEIDLRDLSKHRIKRIVNGKNNTDQSDSNQQNGSGQNVGDGSDNEMEDVTHQDDLQSVPAAGTKLTDKTSKAVYKVTKDGAVGGKVVFLKPLSRNVKKAVIPASVKIDGISYKVTGISADAFKNMKMLKSVSIGDNILSIGSNAFRGCTNLKSVSMGINVKTIGDKAFYKCTALPAIVIPEKVSKIGKQAFYGNKKLEFIIIWTTKLTAGSVGDRAFDGIGSDTVYTVPLVKMDAYKKLLIAKGADL